MKKFKRSTALLLSMALIMSSAAAPSTTVSAAGVSEPTSITLNVDSQESMYVGMSEKVKVKSVKPKNGSKKVTYESSDPEIVKVTGSGTMKAMTEGEAIITVTSAANENVFKEVEVNVKNLVKNKTYNKMVIPLDKKNKTRKLSRTSKVKATYLKLSSSRKKVATVSKAGVLTGKKVGTTKITIKGKKGLVKGAKQVITLYVAKKSVETVALDKTSVTLKPGDPIKLTTSVTPNNAANVVVFTSSDEDVATVDQKGNVKAVEEGTVEITATTVDGNKKAVCVVTVSKDAANKTSEATTEKGNGGATTEKENSGATTEKENGGATTEKENSGATTEKENSGATTEKENSSATTEKENSGATTEKENSGATTEKENSSATTEKENSSATTEKENSGATTEKENSEATTENGNSEVTTEETTEQPVTPENLTARDMYEKAPYISTYYFNPTPTTDDEINIPIYVTDSEQTEYIDKDDSKRFDVVYEVDGEEHYLNNVKAGDMTVPIGKLSAGTHYFAIQSIDRQTGLKSHKVYNDLIVKTSEESIISPEETYTVTDADLTTYKINKNDSTVAEDLETTRDGLTQMFKDLSAKGYQKCILPTGTYRINGENKRFECIMIPSNFTVDMNGSTFKLNTVLANNVGCSIVSMNDEENAHLTNGTLEGDRFERKDLGLETGYLGEPINTFLFRGCKNCSITNMTIKNTTGHTIGTQYVWGPSQKITEYTKTRIVDGEEVPCDDCSTSNMIDLTKMKEWSDYVSVGQAEGYRGIKGESGVIYVHFYDEDQKYLETVTGYQFRKIRIPEKAKYGRVTMLGTLTVEHNVSFHCKHLGDYLEISDIDFIDTRTTAMAPSACNNLLIENCTYTRAGNSITPCAVDFEDGWQECQDVYYRNVKVLESSGTATVIDNTGYNHVYEGIEGHRMILRRGVLGGVIRNSKDMTNTVNWTVGNKIVCKYSRLYNVESGNMILSHSDKESGEFEEFKVRDSVINGTYVNSSTDIVTFEDCVFTKLSGQNFVLKNCVVQPQPFWGENIYCYGCEFKNMETPDGEIAFSFNSLNAERVFENCTFKGKTQLKNHNNFNSGVFKGCEFDDLSMLITLSAKDTNKGIDFIDCNIKSSAENLIHLGPYAYCKDYIDLNFTNCEITHTGENLIYSYGKATDESIIEFDNCTINKESGKMITGWANVENEPTTSLDIIFKGGSVNKELDTSWCGDSGYIRIKYE